MTAAAAPAAPPRQDDGPGVTTLELFFDLVFVFTMTQLTAMLEHGLSIETLAQVVLIFVVLFWMYSGYVWLTNQVPPVTTASRLLLIAGMAGFLVCALAVPHAFGTDGVAFAIGFFVVIVVHSGMFASAYGRGTLGFVPLNFVGATSILAAALIGGTAAYALWLVPIVLTFVSSSLTQRDRGLAESGFTFRGGHLVERHGLLLLVAFGESIVAIGIGLAAVELEPRMYVAAVLGLLLVSALWWTYFAVDDERALEVLQAASPREQLGMAIAAFFYAFVVMLLGVVTIAAGLALTIAAVDVRTSVETAGLLGGGAALYVAGDVLFRLKLGIEPLRYRLAAIPFLLATIPLGSGVSGMAQLLALIGVFIAVLLFEKRARSGTFTAPG
jgi:low temperature requirement protein LtrA